MNIAFTRDLQLRFLKLLSEGEMYEMIPYIKGDLFDSYPYRMLYRAVEGLYLEGLPITKRSLHQRLKEITKEEDSSAIASALEEVKECDLEGVDKDILRSRLDRAIKLSMYERCVRDIIDPLTRGDLEEAEEILMDSLAFKSSVESKGLFYFSEVAKRYEMIDDAREEEGNVVVVKSLIPSLDKVLFKGGFIKRHLVEILARPGVGKSTTLVFLTKSASLQRYNVLHVDLEMTLEETGSRLDAAFTGISTGEQEENKDFIIERLGKLVKKYGDNIYLVSLPPLSTNAAIIKQIILNLKMRGFNTDMVVVDGADYLAPIKSQTDKYLVAGMPYADLKQLAVTEDVLVLADCQVHRSEEGEKDGLITIEGSAHSYLRAMVANTVISLNQTPHEYNENVMRMFLAKQRMGKKFVTLRLNIDLEKCRFKEHKREKVK